MLRARKKVEESKRLRKNQDDDRMSGEPDPCKNEMHYTPPTSDTIQTKPFPIRGNV